MDFITGPGSANKEQAEKSCISLITILFSPQVYIILQTVPVCNAYTQRNLLSGKGKTDRKSRTATAQWEFYRSYGRKNKPARSSICLCVHSCMMLSRSSIMVLCFSKDLIPHVSLRSACKLVFQHTLSVSALGYEKCFVSKGYYNIQTYLPFVV